MKGKILHLLILGVLVQASGGCNQSKSEPGESEAGFTAEVQLPESTPVSIAPVEEKTFVYRIRLQGSIKAAEMAELRFKNSGYLDKIWVHNGRQVSRGALLAQLADDEWQLAVSSAEARRAKAYEDYIKELVDYGGDPRAPHGGIDSTLHERIRTRTGLRAAEIEVAQARLTLRNARLYAPFAGVVADLKRSPGNYITANEVFCRLYNPQTLYLEAEVPESEAPYLRPGLPARLTPLSMPGHSYQARLHEVNPVVNERGMLQLRLRISSPAGLMPGMHAEGIMKVPSHRALCVPKEAVVVRSGKKVVFAVTEDGIAKWHYVQTGAENDREIEITEGLHAGQWVIVSNNLQLAHDSPVEVQDTLRTAP
ncbi:efflux RND transporter periplasmic adaptor subunit [Thermonema rossianum]|jgi:RND family efflux transporter MFP subunit|uniref:efflux RND transporter periplasmic adaptor subunit n=1 Tax=Thermonema rossianum TaxID=55505 RepID=UPI00057036C9|nr:efflux RND transporter periplasmic adaptor subunit [Thermonema rossianum]